MDESGLLGIGEVAQFLGLSIPSLEDKCREGKIPCVEREGRIFFKRAEFRKWFEEKRTILPNRLEN